MALFGAATTGMSKPGVPESPAESFRTYTECSAAVDSASKEENRRVAEQKDNGITSADKDYGTTDIWFTNPDGKRDVRRVPNTDLIESKGLYVMNSDGIYRAGPKYSLQNISPETRIWDDTTEKATRDRQAPSDTGKHP